MNCFSADPAVSQQGIQAKVPRSLTFILLLVALLSTACSTTPHVIAPCALQVGGLAVYATPQFDRDPDRSSAASVYSADTIPPCAPTPTLIATIDPLTPITIDAGTIQNLDHSAAGQLLQSVAVGDDSVAIGWREDGDLWYATAQGGSGLQPQRLFVGDQIGLTYSQVNRLHLVYTAGGQMYYLAADDGNNVSSATPELIGTGSDPQVLIGSAGWTHILYTDSANQFVHKRDRGGGVWDIVPGPAPFGIWGGEQIEVTSIPDDPTTIGNNSAFFATVRDGLTLSVYRLLAPEGLAPQWQEVGRWTTLFAGATPAGDMHIDAMPLSPTNVQLVVTWVTTAAAAPAPFLALQAPRFFEVNPWAPLGVANQPFFHDGLNAVGWETTEIAHDAGLMQTLYTTAGNTVNVQAWAKAWSSEANDVLTNPANMRMQLGLDPTGGRNPDAASVVWSTTHSPINSWQQISVQAVANGAEMTLFMRSRPDVARARSTAYWDEVTATTSYSNGSFEDGFVADLTGAVPVDWQPFWQDNAVNAPPRQPYTGYAVFSADSGNTWSAPQAVTSNQLPAQGATGALSTLHPHLLPQGRGIVFFYLYEHGDIAQAGQRRFGRLHATHCAADLSSCDNPPGEQLFARTTLRPLSNLMITRDPFDAQRALAFWQMVQTDNELYDLLGTWLEMR